ncbi:MAG: C13 family peptidase [Verrucomicrobiota bacterium]
MSDEDLIIANLGKQSSATNAEVRLFPDLRVFPDRRTLLEGESLDIYATGSSNPITWFQVEVPSGSSISTQNSTSITYQAGTTSGVVDILQAWDGDYQFGRTFVNIIGSNDITAAGKAIILAGGKTLDDVIWDATEYLGDKAYNTLRYRGFSKENIRYLTFNPGQDVDQNGRDDDDIHGSSSFSNVEATFTSPWVASGTDKLFLYMVDHGSRDDGSGVFRLNLTNFLSSGQLDQWLDDIQDTYTNVEVTVVLDFCYAGSFLQDLTYTDPTRRMVIAATSAHQLTYFAGGGLVSFSDVFFSALIQGLNVFDAFELARDAMSSYPQSSVMDDDGDGLYQPGIDGAEAAQLDIGATFVAGKDIPIIGSIIGRQLLSDGGTRATLWVDNIDSAYTIQRVWCTVIAPSHNPDPDSGQPVVDLPELDLTYNVTNGRYEVVFDGFTEEGTYQVICYALDEWNSISLPKPTFVTQAGFDEQVILVAGLLTCLAHM